MNFIRRIILAALLLGAISASAQTTNYVRAGASGANNGTDWNNAFTSFPSTLNRGEVYMVAGGSYGTNYEFNDNNSGTTPITILFATEANHGIDTGWSNTYDDIPATWTGEWSWTRDYYFISGQTRDSLTWSNSYGFRVGTIWNFAETDGAAGDHITLLYLDLGGSKTYWGQNWCSNMTSCIDIKGGGWKTNIVIANCLISQPSFAQNAFVDGITYTNNLWAYGNKKEAIRGQYACKNGKIINNRFVEASMGNVDEEGELCDPEGGDSSHTAVIGIWDDQGNGAGVFDNWEIKGNNIWYRRFVENDGPNGAIIIGGGTGWSGVHANNVTVSTNTIVGYESRNASIIINGGDSAGTGKVAQGNGWYDCSSYSVSSANVTAADNGNLGAAPWTTWNEFIAYGLPDGGGEEEPEAPSGPTATVGTLIILGQ